MKCFITGGTGFVGGHLCDRLAREGHEVYAIVRKTSKKKHLKNAKVRLINADLDAINVFARHAGGIDLVFHLAAITKANRPRDFYHVNTDGTENLLRGLKRGAFQGRLVLLSSLAAGGPVEDAKSPRSEESPDNPVSHYGKSKRQAEEAARKLLPEGSSLSILRPGAIYGPREKDIYEVVKTMKKTGLSFQIGHGVEAQMTHVEDVVDGLMRAGFSEEAAGRLYYLNDEQAWSVREMTRLAAEGLGRRVRTIRVPVWAARGAGFALDFFGRVAGRPLSPLTRDKVRELTAGAWAADSSRIRKELGWQPRWDLPAGLQQTIKWYRDNKQL